MNRPSGPTTSEIIVQEPEEIIPIESVSISMLTDDCLMHIFDLFENMEDLESIRQGKYQIVAPESLIN